MSSNLNDYFLLYSGCDKWVLGSKFIGLPGSGHRYGHSALLDPTDDSLLVFAGFTGDLHHDLLRLDPGMYGYSLVTKVSTGGSALVTTLIGGYVRQSVFITQHK